MSVDKIYDISQEYDFYIYGTGKVAEKFYHLMKEKNLLARCKGFVVSDFPSNVDSHHSLPVYSINEIEYDDWMFIATNVTNYMEIKSLLETENRYNYLWIYTIMYDLAFGKPIYTAVEFNVASLIKKISPNIWITICYLALKDHYEGECHGKDLYIKFVKNVFSKDIAQKDLKRFLEYSIQIRDEFLFDSNIKINHDKTILLDGAHRIALAAYFGKKIILADIYQCTENMLKKFSTDGLSMKEWENKNLVSFSDEEIKLIQTEKNVISEEKYLK